MELEKVHRMRIKKLRTTILSEAFQPSNKKNLMLDRPTSHGPWPEGEDDPLVSDQIYNYLKSMQLCNERLKRKRRIIASFKRKIRNIVKEEFQSHTFEPTIGDEVRNTNKNCKHYGSEGVVISVEDLPRDLGKTARYVCTNSGRNWRSGQVLEKTMDQLSPLE
jgi:hypothetical protein